MSRTYRKHLVTEYRIRGVIYDENNIDDILKLYDKVHTFGFYGGWHHSSRHSIIKKVRDGKPWYKPNKEFKQMNRRLERSEVKNAIRSGKEVLPIFKKRDVWEWT